MKRYVCDVVVMWFGKDDGNACLSVCLLAGFLRFLCVSIVPPL